MFRVFLDGDRKLEFWTYNEFAAWRLKAAAEGYKPFYVCSIRVRCNDYIYCYQLRKVPVVNTEES